MKEIEKLCPEEKKSKTQKLDLTHSLNLKSETVNLWYGLVIT